MMKKTWCFLLTVIMLLTTVPISAVAAESATEVIIYPDGSYMTVELTENQGKASGSITGSKKSTYYSNSGSVEWVAVLTGNFSYTGSSATCTNSSMSVIIQNSSWAVVSKSATRSGNTAYGAASVGLRAAGVTINTVPVNLSLSCDRNGNLS